MKWKSVINEFPRHKQEVLVYVEDDKEIHKAIFNCSEEYGVIWEEPYYGQDVSSPFQSVSFWMELPAHPKNGAKND